MDYNWGKAFFASLDFPHLGYHSEDDVDIVGDSVVRPASVLELGHYPTFVFAVTLHFKCSLNTVVCKPVFFLLKLYILFKNTSHQFTEMSWHKGRDFIFKDRDFAILQRADLMVIFKEFQKLF